MALRNYRLSVILITILINISLIWTWNIDDRRYNSYNLEKGPVFYEAYYQNDQNTPKNYQDKRYFDRGAVLERIFQIPSEHIGYRENSELKGTYEDNARQMHYDNQYFSNPKFSRMESYPETTSLGESKFQDYDIKKHNMDSQDKVSAINNLNNANLLNQLNDLRLENIEKVSNSEGKIVRRNSGNWNLFESNLDRSRYQNPNPKYRQDIDTSDLRQFQEIEQPIIENKMSSLHNIFQQNDNLKETKYFPNLRSNYDFTIFLNRKHSPEVTDNPTTFQKLLSRNIEDQNVFRNRDLVSYQEQQPRYFEPMNKFETEELRKVNIPESQQTQTNLRMTDSIPPENIFAPRPQVINYIFSKSPSTDRTEKPLVAQEMLINKMPRKYGDNLVQEGIKEINESKKQNAKVTSIEVSEVPRHKTRHHHGEWLLDYSHRH